MAVPLKSTSSMSSSQCSSSSSPTSSSIKLKALIQSLIITQVCRLIREISRVSSIIVRVLRKKQYNLLSLSSSFNPKRASKKQKNNIFFGSFRLHYNFCSSHVVPVSTPVRLPEELYLAHLQYDSTWESMHSSESMDVRDDDGEFQEPPQLSRYLRELEGKVKDGEEEGKEMVMMNEIDKLADLFIANCHEKFLLEKVDSYRRFQETLKTCD
uniref:Cotton fiber protein n=1 Tax=Noccaea caerulescens TaxID=107243 RepID=A0A1J3DIP1_NOCCA